MRRCSYCGSHDHPYELCPKTWSGNAKEFCIKIHNNKYKTNILNLIIYYNGKFTSILKSKYQN